ncbi:carbohydrate kinase family protein [Actinomadura hibisca]|uniref:carbohydrate kinase family protein n=1 Tax=Actinomadura hibisca TaxID=68565 RepID=UPI001C3F2BC5|nr:carbohydrate kinase [Actinomadura hibisca]
MEHIAVIGEAVADAFLPGGEAGGGDGLRLAVRAGGGPANTAVALARLGTPARFLGRLSDGPFGRLLRHHLVSSGVDVSGCVDAPENATLAVTAIDAAGQAGYDFYAGGTADWQWTRAELAARRPDAAACVHTGSLALVLPPGGPLIEDLLTEVRDSTTISIDPNVRPGMVPAADYRARLGRWTRLADVVRLSEEDLAHLAPGKRAETVCDAWHRDGVRLVVVTRGQAGVTASLDGRRVSVDAPPVEVVDTVGAGDAFMAGLLHAFRHGGFLGGRLEALTEADLERALGFATGVAAETCRVPGADPPWAERLDPAVRALSMPGRA